MAEQGPDDERPYFGPARIFAGVALVVAAILYVLVVSPITARPPDAIVIGLLLGSGGLMLGVEGLRALIAGRS